MRGRENSCTKCRIVFFFFSPFFANDCSQRAVVGLPVKDDGLFNIPPHFPPFRLPDPSSSSSSSSIVVVVVVPRKRSRSMRKLPRQELLTINYSSRYTLSLRATPFRALSTVTHANDGGARGLRTQHSPLTYRYTGIFGRRKRERGGGGRPGSQYRGGGRSANLHFIARARDRLPGSLLALSRIFIRFLFSTTLPTT